MNSQHSFVAIPEDYLNKVFRSWRQPLIDADLGQINVIPMSIYRQVSNIRRTLVSMKLSITQM